MGLKRCSRCSEIKPYDEFYVNRALKDGRQTICIICDLSQQSRVAGKRATISHGDGCTCETCVAGCKTCIQCKLVKPLDDFGNLKASPDGRQQHCRKCQSIRTRLRRYGIDEHLFQSMIKSQDGRCAICSRQFDNEYPPHIDHDHSCCTDRNETCGKCVRKLLCKPCNTALGQINDNPEIAISLAAYLIGYQDVVGTIGGVPFQSR